MSSRLRSLLAILAAALVCVMTLCAGVQAVQLGATAVSAPALQPGQSQSPATWQEPGRPMVAAYFEAGPYWEFNLLQKEIIKALQQRGVAARIVFPDDLHISPGWDAPNSVYRAEARKLMSNPAIDVIISMGTEATKALLAENNGKTPIMSVDVADPAGAGIVDRATGKGAANLTIRYTKDKWFKVFALFHEALPFLRLGIMYHDSPEGLSYSNVREAREVARERGFTLVEYPFLDKAESMPSEVNAAENTQTIQNRLKCYEENHDYGQRIQICNNKYVKSLVRHARKGIHSRPSLGEFVLNVDMCPILYNICMRFGKPLASFAGMDEMLAELGQSAAGIRRVTIIDARGSTLYEQPAQDSKADSTLPPGAASQTREGKDGPQGAIKTADGYRLSIPLSYKTPVGHLLVDIDGKPINAATEDFLRLS